MGPASKRLRVIVTRAAEQIEPLAGRIEELGHEVVRCPLIELEPTGPDAVDLDGYDWAIVTSAHGARELARRGRGRWPRVAAIGPGTAAALREHAVEPVPTAYDCDMHSGVRMHIHPLDGNRVAFDPYPFDVRPLTLHSPYRRLERAAFDDGDDFRRAYFQAVPELLTYQVE